MSLFHLLRIPIAIKGLLTQLRTQRRFLKQHVQPLLRKSQEKNDGSLGQEDFKKILTYYGLAVPAVLGEAFCRLHCREMTLRERKASTAQGAMTGLFDDFFDKMERSPDSIETLLRDDSTAVKSNEQLFLEFYQAAQIAVPDKQEMLRALTKVHKAQADSLRQVMPTISSNEIAEITYEKGGTSLLFYRTAFSPSPSTAETKLLHKLGGLMQLANDIFDVYKDRENGIRTLVTQAVNINEIKSTFKTGISESFVLLISGSFDQKASLRFFEILSLAIFSRAMVCIQQLQQLQTTTNGQFKVDQYSRGQLICDMEKPRNLLRCARYHGSLMTEFARVTKQHMATEKKQA